MATLTSNSLDNCTSIPNFFATGTKMVFCSSAAPSSWTKLTTHNNKALRVVTGPALTPGPADPATADTFETVFPASQRPIGGTVTAASSAATVGPVQTTVTGSIQSTAAYPSLTLQTATVAETQTAIHNHSYTRHDRNQTNSAPQTGPLLMIKNTTESFQTSLTGAGGGHQHAFPAPAPAVLHGHDFTASGHTHTISSSGPHSHPFSTIAQDFAIKYVNVIVCSKD